jgi:uncharacterized peroxidase-related enzyme
MTFFFRPVPVVGSGRAKAFLPGAGRSPSGDTRREKDAEHPRQTGGLVRTPTAFYMQRRHPCQERSLLIPQQPALPSRCSMKSRAPSARHRTCAVANSPAALKSMWGAFGALGAGTIGAKLGEKIAVAVADRDACSYCLAAHTLLGKNAGASGQDMADAQAGHSDDPKTAAALAFALKLVEHRGQVADADIEALRAAGFHDGQIVEIIAHVALNLFTNYVNIALDGPVDFPSVKFRRAP